MDHCWSSSLLSCEYRGVFLCAVTVPETSTWGNHPFAPPSSSLNSTHQGHNWTCLRAQSRNHASWLRCSSLIRISDGTTPSPAHRRNQSVCHFLFITTNSLNCWLFLPRLHGCCRWRSCSGLIALSEMQTEICLVNEFSRLGFVLSINGCMSTVFSLQMDCCSSVPWPGWFYVWAVFKLPTCVPSDSRGRPSESCLFLKPGAQAAHLVTTADLAASSPGPPVASALCIGRQINEVFAFLWQSITFQKVSEGSFTGKSELCRCGSPLGSLKDQWFWMC